MCRSWNEGVRGREVLPLINLNAETIRVEAGPGTGKTFGLVRRVERILHPEGLAASGRDVLVVAFNRVISKQLQLEDDGAYLLLDGVWMKVRRSFGPQRVLLLVAYGIRPNGERRLLAFLRARGESQAAWEGMLQNLFQRGLRGHQLHLIITDGCAGLTAALQTVYPAVPHQRCWVHKMRNLCQAVRRRDHQQVKRDAQKIYQATHWAEARQAFRAFQRHWQVVYPRLVKSLEKDLPELLNFFHFPKHLWKKLRTTNAIERCFVEVRRRTRPMVVFTNVQSVDRIIFAIFNRFNEDWQNHTLELFTQRA